MDELRVAFFAAVPGDQDRLMVETEYKSIEAELEKSRFSERFDLRFIPATQRRDLLSRLLKVKPQIIHFSGHGTDREELIFENDRGLSEPVGPKELAELFALIPASERPRAVVLSACYSEGQAAAIAKSLDCAIGMSSQIPDDDAVSFAVGFYGGLAEGLSVNRAVDAGRFAMSHGTRDLPHLHVNPEAALTELTLVGQGPVNSFPDELQIDRDEEVERFNVMLDTGEPKVLLVTADGNMGKSQLIRRMARSARAKAAPVGYADLSYGPPTPIEILTRIASELGTTAVSDASGPYDTLSSIMAPRPDLQASRHRDLVALTTQVLEHAEQLGSDQGRNVALLLDGYDDSEGDVAAFVETILLPNAIRAAHVVCVVAGRQKPKMVAGIDLYEARRLSNFGENHVREALQFLRLGTSADHVRTVWAVSENGNPYLTTATLYKAWAVASGRAP